MMAWDSNEMAFLNAFQVQMLWLEFTGVFSVGYGYRESNWQHSDVLFAARSDEIPNLT